MPDKTVLLTGGASGIGLAAARTFARDGWSVALVDLDAPGLERAGQELAREGPAPWTCACDVADHSAVQRAARAALGRFGVIDVLVNNAGISQQSTIVDLKEEDWDRTLGVNLKGAFHWSKALLPSMLERGSGKIINVSSVSAKHGGGPGTVSKACYAASKAGLLGLTRGLAREVAPHIQVNAVCPGLIETPMTRELIARSGPELAAQIPLKRLGTPEDVAGAIWFLASPLAAYITGEIIDVNGGLYMD